MFLDEAVIEAKAGDGGNGAVSFRREKFVPRGGPDGGDGGHGGSVIAVTDPHLRTLTDFARRTQFRAGDGGRGGPNHRRGKRGADLEIRLPVGVVISPVTRDQDERLVVDLAGPGQRVVLVRGGRGGRGNARLTSSTRQAPRFAEKGEPGQRLHLALELKLLADVGVIGLPNVGKSSLIARVSAARPKIADYPFTTLAPTLGVVRLEEGTSFVIADLPGLVEGAHQGVGLGHAFLRHVERTRLLIHMLDMGVLDRDPRGDFAMVNRELSLYQAELARRPQLVALNKMDLHPPAEKLVEVEDYLREQGWESFPVSAVTGLGIKALLARAAQLLSAGSPGSPVRPETRPVGQRAPWIAPSALRVEKLEQGIYEVSGERVERAVVMTDLDNEEAVRYLHRRLERMGVIRKLRALGAKEGDRVKIGPMALDFTD